MTKLTALALAAAILGLIQTAAAVPWLLALFPKHTRIARKMSLTNILLTTFGIFAGLTFAVMFQYRDATFLEGMVGRVFGAVLQFQIAVDLLILVLFLLLRYWRKGGAVALAAFRESIRQPMFWVIAGLSLFFLTVSVVLPYFTFGDDFKMMSHIGFDLIMLATGLFGVLAAGLSVYDEIEGRTAITLMSKPVNRRQFLLGKYLGILLGCAAMTILLGWFLNWAMFIKPNLDRYDESTDPLSEPAVVAFQQAMFKLPFNDETRQVMIGAGAWLGEAVTRHLGLMLGFGQVMILVALATALATRVPYVVTFVLILVVYLLGHLAPVLVRYSAGLSGDGVRLVGFLAQALEVVLPALEFFNMGPVLVRNTPLEFGQFAGYVGQVTIYSVVYTAIAMLFGLILFEDRDLA